jgi:hypothetical protein
MKEAMRYLQNAKEILRKAPHLYPLPKWGRGEGEGGVARTAYLAILKAIDEYLLNKRLSKPRTFDKVRGKKELLRSVDAYRKALQKHLAVHNGKLLREFERNLSSTFPEYLAAYCRDESRTS